jgi:ATP-dependent Clp protease ATP-binding subunit ClpC
MAEQYEGIGHTLRADSWKQTKEAAFELISQSEFWDSPDRFSILDEVEYLDRIEAGYETAGSLLEKLRRSTSFERASVPRHLTERLAQQLYLLASACRSVINNEPRDAFLLIESAQETSDLTRVNNEFAVRLAKMYRGWSQKRRMKIKILRESKESRDQPYHLLAAVSGYAAYHILAHEHGLHLFEIPETEKSFLRAKVQVLVAPQPDEPAGPELEDWRSQAESAIAGSRRESLKVVRRYREEPSPLVRDGVRNWKTGRIDRVLNGDFDLFGGLSAKNPL